MSVDRVLVVDDNRDLVEGIAMLLREVPYEVEVAHSGEQALTRLAASEFGLVLSDIRMPRMGGLALLESIRERCPLTKVVLLTAYGSVDTAVEAMRNGACDYLTKPFDNDELVRVVARAFAGGVAAGGFHAATVVGDVARAVSSGELLPGLRAALGVLLRATGADDGEIFLCEPEGRDLLLCVCAGADGAALAERPRFALNVGYPGIVAASGMPLGTRGGLAGDPRYLRRAVTHAGIRSLAAVPLHDPRGVLGSVHLMSRRDDFSVEHVLELLERAASPIATAVRAALATLRQSVDAICSPLEEESSSALLGSLLESMRQVAGAQHGSLALVDPDSGRPTAVVSTGPASLICTQAEAGAWRTCPSVLAAHGFVGEPGRRHWPECCRRSLPPRAASPCCLPMIAQGRLFGIAVLDFGRDGTDHATGRLVPLLSMAQQAAVRLKGGGPGFRLEDRGAAGPGVATSHVDEAVADIELRCLGPFAVYRRGVEVPRAAFTRTKAIPLLARLALSAGAPVSREVLIEQLWPGVDPAQGANRLHGVVHALRSVIEPRRAERQSACVRTLGELYYLDMGSSIRIDLLRYRRMLADAGRLPPGRAAESIALLEQAVALYRGDLFEDDPYAEWAEADRQELKECQTHALGRLAELHAAAGAHEESLACLRRALRVSPFREDLLLTKLTLLARLGRSSEALAIYKDYCLELEAQLDAVPSEELQTLERRLCATARRPAAKGSR